MALNPALQKLIASGVNKYGRSGGSRLKPKEGVNRYRFVAPTDQDVSWLKPDGQFWADVGVHWIKADLDGKPLAVVGCDSIVNDKPCAVCTAIDLALNNPSNDEDSKKLYESWKPNKSVFVNAIDRTKGSTTGDEPQLLELTPTTWGKVMAVVQQFADEGQDILSLDEGLDIAIVKSGKGLNTEYSVNVAAGVSKPAPASVMKNLTDVFAYVQKEFFRGEETKALNAITQIAGVTLPRLGGPAPQIAQIAQRTPTAALKSAAAQVEDAEVEEVVEEIEEAPAPKKTVAKAPPVEPEIELDANDVDDVLAELDNL